MAISLAACHDGFVPAKLTYENEIVRIADLAVVDGMVRNRTFINCLVVGPAVLAPLEGTSIENNIFTTPDARAMFWIIEPNRPEIVGAVGLENCQFEECRFERIGFAGPEDVRAAFLGMGVQ